MYVSPLIYCIPYDTFCFFSKRLIFALPLKMLLMKVLKMLSSTYNIMISIGLTSPSLVAMSDVGTFYILYYEVNLLVLSGMRNKL